ncbi:MAG: C25 family cysteine peptidase [Candidatus Thermoplasmatota archaeon]
MKHLALIVVAIFLLPTFSIEKENSIKWLKDGYPDIKINKFDGVGIGIIDGKRCIISKDKYYEIFNQASLYDFLIISPDEWLSEIELLKQHKESKGIKTIVVGLDEIYNHPSTINGRDNAEKIKYFIKNAIEEWGIKYVLLVGDIYNMPIRNALHIWRDGTQLREFPIPTDLYYADIYRYEDGKVVFSSWDTNGNGKYGEEYEDGYTQGDIIDLYPDIYLGRIACENKIIVRQVINKIKNYENKTKGEEWFNKIVLIGGDTFPGWGVLEGEVMNEIVAEIMNDFQPYRIQYSLGNLNTLEIYKALQKGCGFLYYSGHGFPYGWATHGSSEEWIGRYFTPYILTLSNDCKLPVIFFDACLTAKLDFNSSDLREDGIPIPFNASFPCFAWYFIRHPRGGAIATVGATRVAFTGVDEDGPHWGASYLAYKFFNAYRKTQILGEVFANAQIGYASSIWDTWTIEEFILLGDPTLKIGGY